MTYKEFYQRYSTDAGRKLVYTWLGNALEKKYETEPKDLEKAVALVENEEAKDPDVTLQYFWHEFSKMVLKNPDLEPDDILDPAEQLGDADIIPDENAPKPENAPNAPNATKPENALKPQTLQELVQLWQAARTTADQARAVDGVGLAMLQDAPVLPADFINDLIDYGSPDVAKAARKLRVQAPSGKELTMRPKQAFQFLRTQGVSVDHLSVTTSTLLDVHMPDTTLMWELDFSSKKAQLGSVDRAGNFKPLKKFKLSDGFIHDLADFWKKNS